MDWEKDRAAYRAMGRELLKATEVKEGENPRLRLVLCRIDSANHTPYVVWMENLEDSERVGHPATFGGDYFTSFRDADAKYHERAARNGML